MPFDQTCLFRLVSIRTSGVPIIFSANFLISFIALGARRLKPLREKAKVLRETEIRPGQQLGVKYHDNHFFFF